MKIDRHGKGKTQPEIQLLFNEGLARREIAVVRGGTVYRREN